MERVQILSEASYSPSFNLGIYYDLDWHLFQAIDPPAPLPGFKGSAKCLYVSFFRVVVETFVGFPPPSPNDVPEPQVGGFSILTSIARYLQVICTRKKQGLYSLVLYGFLSRPRNIDRRDLWWCGIPNFLSRFDYQSSGPETFLDVYHSLLDATLS